MIPNRKRGHEGCTLSVAVDMGAARYEACNDQPSSNGPLLGAFEAVRIDFSYS